MRLLAGVQEVNEAQGSGLGRTWGAPPPLGLGGWPLTGVREPDHTRGPCLRQQPPSAPAPSSRDPADPPQPAQLCCRPRRQQPPGLARSPWWGRPWEHGGSCSSGDSHLAKAPPAPAAEGSHFSHRPLRCTPRAPTPLPCRSWGHGAPPGRPACSSRRLALETDGPSCPLCDLGRVP